MSHLIASKRFWQRVQLPNGAYIWVRTALPLLKKKDSLITRLRNSTRMRRDPRGGHLSETIAEQLHRKNAATMGFYSELDEDGNVSWKYTTDAVSISIMDEEGELKVGSGRGLSRPTMASSDDLAADAGGMTGTDDDDLDLEGLMSLPFKQKKRWFLKKLAAIAIPFTQSLYKVRVRRSHVLEDSIDILTCHHIDTQSKEHLNIHFVGEPALDAGGVLREWFGLVSEGLFSADRGVFTTTNGENASYWINPNSRQALGSDHLTYFLFAGRFIGRAILEGLVFDVHLSLPLLKH
jgi:hypothetical protein